MSELPHILLVDDNPNDLMLLMNKLKDDYRVNAVRSGAACLEKLAADDLPDIVIMDISMPEMDGYETCQRMRSDERLRAIDVIFLSANDTTEEKLLGMEAGAVDYITKPFDSEILRSKIRYCIQQQHQRQALAAEKQQAFQTAMTALTNAGELGIVLEFMRALNATEDLDALGALVVQCVGRFGCSSVFQIRDGNELRHYSSSGDVSGLERELLTQLKDGGRIVERGQRSIFNFRNLSLLVKNMPDDDDLRGRYRDHVPTLLEGTVPKLEALLARERNKILIGVCQDALQRFEIANQNHQDSCRRILDKVVSDLQESFLTMGLDDEQETRLLGLVEAGLDEMMDQQDVGASMEHDLKSILDAVNKIQ